MPQSPRDETHSQPSVLAILKDRSGLAPKVLLPDSDSVLGPSPLVSPTSAAAKLVPQGRGHYQLLGEIARGGMGVILKGHDTDLGRDVAVKVLDAELAARPEVVQRFVEEAQIGGQLQHPGIVPVYELGLMADERPYFTMKLIKGHTLASLLQQRRTPADNRGRLLAIFESVCQTVAYAHSKGVLHRDLKPANVMVGAFGEVQVVDWGLAKVLRRGGIADEKRAKETVHTIIATVRSGPGSSGSDSMVGSVMGTPAYMAPEQAQGEVELLDERADVFSLGAILCEMLTGRPPYEDVPGESIVMQAAHAKLLPARERIEGCEADPALIRLCLTCLMPARAARPANAGDVAKAVHEFLASVEERAQKSELAAAEARIKAAEERRARRLTLALAATIVTALTLAGGGAWWAGKERAKRGEELARRAEQTRTAVEAAYGESLELGQAGKHAEALVAARRALSLAETGEADAALLERAKKFVAKAELDVGAAGRERERVLQDERLRSRLIDLRLEQIATIGNKQREIELDAAFAQAFHDYGVDLEVADLTPALARIRERSIAEEVAL
ncbi:MAG TPA: protein kinase, partial [Planctomycetota bacterium]|nr:protein kinase [Planctomycetota bacterium]